MSGWVLKENSLFAGTLCLIAELDPAISLTPLTHGCLLEMAFSRSAFRHRLRLGVPRQTNRFVACYRHEPFWMNVRHGRHFGQLPPETQYALFELSDASYLLLVPLTDAPYRTALAANEDGLALVVDSADPAVHAAKTRVLYVAHGQDPHLLCEQGAPELRRELASSLQTPSSLEMNDADRRVHSEPQSEAPGFVAQFGWCTWDSFYRSVSHEACLTGLGSFEAGGVRPRWMVLDDGWQALGPQPELARLQSFDANSKFPRGLAYTVELAKQRYGIETFMVWHAVHGYWAGLDEVAFERYAPQRKLRWYSPEVLAQLPDMNLTHSGPYTFRPAATELACFYDDYHAQLSSLGVDGVKVDNQASLEAVARGHGGRVADFVATQRALWQSTQRYFRGNLLNCMACSNEAFYHSPSKLVMRTSGDYLPSEPNSHATHLLNNAHVGLWFGKFVIADWDMFQSAHAYGAYHAAARAVSGGPLYVSDPPGQHDFELLRSVVLSDGSVPRALDAACPTRDSLFVKPGLPQGVLKVYNRTAASFVVGAFSIAKGSARRKRLFRLSPGDVPQMLRNDSGDCAVYLVEGRRLLRLGTREQKRVALGTRQFEIAVVVPIADGLAAVGLVDYLNPGGCVRTVSRPENGVLRASFRDGGRALFYCARAPSAVFVDQRQLTDPFHYEPRTRALFIDLARGAEHEVEVRLEPVAGS